VPMSTLHTDRLLLRLPEANDFEPLVAIHEHPDVVHFLGGNPKAGRTAAWRTLAQLCGHWTLRGYGPWIVVEQATGEVIGRVGLWNPEGWPGIELGWVIRRSHWGGGLATEAARAALRWAWDHVDSDHIISIIQPGNVRSIRVAEKLGERLERQDVMDGSSVCIYGVSRRETDLNAPGEPKRDPRTGTHDDA
jgi:RimJ/RimL family protein N-acetyltransferase